MLINLAPVASHIDIPLVLHELLGGNLLGSSLVVQAVVLEKPGAARNVLPGDFLDGVILQQLVSAYLHGRLG